MKTILCYGDSNTWGYNPATQDRFGPQERWPGVLAQALGPDYRVIEEGLGGRTTVWDDPIEEYRNGKAYLIPCLESHKPLDLVVLMLGTNDLKKRFSVSAFDIAAGAALLVNIIQSSRTGPSSAPPDYAPLPGKPLLFGNSEFATTPEILLVAPPPIARLSGYAEMFEGAEEKSSKLAGFYRQAATEIGCHFLDAGEVIVSSDLDGIHLEPDQHRKLGQAVADCVRGILVREIPG